MTYKTWGEMTPEEKGALLLAYHGGKKLQIYVDGHGWWSVIEPMWDDSTAYRVKPEPKRETVTIGWVRGGVDYTHHLTFDMIDGEPDCASVQMEKL